MARPIPPRTREFPPPRIGQASGEVRTPIGDAFACIAWIIWCNGLDGEESVKTFDPIKAVKQASNTGEVFSIDMGLEDGDMIQAWHACTYVELLREYLHDPQRMEDSWWVLIRAASRYGRALKIPGSSGVLLHALLNCEDLIDGDKYDRNLRDTIRSLRQSHEELCLMEMRRKAGSINAHASHLLASAYAFQFALKDIISPDAALAPSAPQIRSGRGSVRQLQMVMTQVVNATQAILDLYRRDLNKYCRCNKNCAVSQTTSQHNNDGGTSTDSTQSSSGELNESSDSKEDATATMVSKGLSGASTLTMPELPSIPMEGSRTDETGKPDEPARQRFNTYSTKALGSDANGAGKGNRPRHRSISRTLTGRKKGKKKKHAPAAPQLHSPTLGPPAERAAPLSARNGQPRIAPERSSVERSTAGAARGLVKVSKSIATLGGLCSEDAQCGDIDTRSISTALLERFVTRCMEHVESHGEDADMDALLADYDFDSKNALLSADERYNVIYKLLRSKLDAFVRQHVLAEVKKSCREIRDVWRILKEERCKFENHVGRQLEHTWNGECDQCLLIYVVLVSLRKRLVGRLEFFRRAADDNFADTTANIDIDHMQRVIDATDSIKTDMIKTIKKENDA